MQKKAPALRSIKQKKGARRPAKERHQNERQAIANAISTLTNTVAAERKADREQQQRSERGKSFREWATIALLFITAGFVLGQLREMQKVYAPIAEQAQYTRESYVAVQRAFIGDVRLTLTPDELKDGKPTSWSPQITVKNTGATPTMELEYVSMFSHRVPDFPPADKWFEQEAKWGRILKGRLTIGPGAEAEIMVPPFAGIAALNETYPDGSVYGEQAGALAGAIRYKDRFSDSEVHLTRYCFIVWRMSNGQASSIMCSRWNCSDEDCKHDKNVFDPGEPKLRPVE